MIERAYRTLRRWLESESNLALLIAIETVGAAYRDAIGTRRDALARHVDECAAVLADVIKSRTPSDDARQEIASIVNELADMATADNIRREL